MVLSTQNDQDGEKQLLLASRSKRSGKSQIINVASHQDLLDHMGGIGRWQILSLCLLWFPSMAAGILVLLQNFTALEPHGEFVQITRFTRICVKQDDWKLSGVPSMSVTFTLRQSLIPSTKTSLKSPPFVKHQ